MAEKKQEDVEIRIIKLPKIKSTQILGYVMEVVHKN